MSDFYLTGTTGTFTPHLTFDAALEAASKSKRGQGLKIMAVVWREEDDEEPVHLAAE